MLKGLAILIPTLSLIVLGANPQAHKAKQGQANQQTSSPVAPLPAQKGDGARLQATTDQHVQADVRVISSPGKDRYDIASFGAGVILAIVGIAGIVVGVCTLLFIKEQAIEMRRQRAEMRRQRIVMRSTLSSIKEQTIQLERQVTASHDGLRAWIGVTVSQIEDNSPFATLHRRLAHWTLNNYGQTPAFIKSVSMANAAFDPDDQRWKVPRQPREVYGFLGASRNENNLLELSGDALVQFEQGQRIWRVVVRIEYDDAFGKSHETMASFHYHLPRSTGDPLKEGFYQDHDPTTNYNR